MMDLNKVLAVHRAALEYTVNIQQTVAVKSEQETTKLVARAAVSSLMHDVACLHQAIKPLCGTGWAAAAPILLRSMLEGSMSVAVIVNSDRPDVAGFKYLYQKIPDEIVDPVMKPAIERQMQDNLCRQLPQMTPDDQTAARAFLDACAPGPYWYSGMFRGPTTIIRAYLNTEMLHLYGLLSTATHVGFVGLRMFRDEPDKLDINSRRDPGAQGFAMISSSRVLAEATRLREHFEALNTLGYEMVMRMIGECASS